MNKWGGEGIKRQRALVNDTGEYEFNTYPMPCNFTQIDQNVPPNTKVEFDTEFRRVPSLPSWPESTKLMGLARPPSRLRGVL